MKNVMGKKMMLGMIWAGLMLCSLPALALQTVGTGGTHATINDALAVASINEEIRILDSNTYTENITLSIEGIQLTADAGQSPTIASDAPSPLIGVLTAGLPTPINTGGLVVAAPNVQIQGITINPGAAVSLTVDPNVLPNPAAGVTLTGCTLITAGYTLVNGGAATLNNSMVNAGFYCTFFNAGAGVTIENNSQLQASLNPGLGTYYNYGSGALNLLSGSQILGVSDFGVVMGAGPLVLNNATISGPSGCSAVVSTGDITVENGSLIEVDGNTSGYGLNFSGNTTVVVDGSEIRGGTSCFVTTADAPTITVRNNSSIGGAALGMELRQPGTVTVTDSSITTCSAFGLSVRAAGTSVTLTNVELTDNAVGAEVTSSGINLICDSCVFTPDANPNNRGLACVYAGTEPSTITVTNCNFTGLQYAILNYWGEGLNLDVTGGSVTGGAYGFDSRGGTTNISGVTLDGMTNVALAGTPNGVGDSKLDMTVSGCTVSNCDQALRFEMDGDLVVSNTDFADVTNDSIYVSSGTLNISNCNMDRAGNGFFVLNKALQVTADTVTATDCANAFVIETGDNHTLTDCTASSSTGTGLWLRGTVGHTEVANFVGDGVAYGVLQEGGTADFTGGNLTECSLMGLLSRNNQDVETTLTSTLFDYNQKGAQVEAGTIILDGCTFTDNVEEALFVGNQPQVEVLAEGCIFTNNATGGNYYLSQQGGKLVLDNCDINLHPCIYGLGLTFDADFEARETDFDDGGQFLIWGDKAQFTSCTFGTNANAFAHNTYIGIRTGQTTFTACTVQDRDGARMTDTLLDCTFMESNSPVISVVDSTIYTNRIAQGSNVPAGTSEDETWTLNLTNSTFDGLSSGTWAIMPGGQSTTLTLAIEDCDFRGGGTENPDARHGAFLVDSNGGIEEEITATITNSTFNGYENAFVLYGDTGSSYLWDQVTFYDMNYSAIIVPASVVGESTLPSRFDGTLNVTDSIFDSMQFAFHVDECAGTATEDYNVYGNGISGATGGGMTVGTNSKDSADAMFISISFGSADFLRPEWNSPAAKFNSDMGSAPTWAGAREPGERPTSAMHWALY